MQYRKFGGMDFQVSSLGFGAMRLPTVNNKIDVEPAIQLIRTAIDNGVNYIDTAYVYHAGESEIIVGKALKDGYREKVKIATKSPVWLIEKEEDFDRLLDEQLKKLDVDKIDFYLLHALGESRWRDTILKFNVLEKMEKAKAAGKIDHIGFSFHDKLESFYEIIDGYDKWEFCQIQLNYMDTEHQAGMKGLQYAYEKGLGVIIMEPLRGGKLTNPPPRVSEIMKEANPERTAVEWSLNWLWNLPEPSVLLSGMSTMEQVLENINYADNSRAGMMTNEELETIAQVQEKYKEIDLVPCTACQYCMPCPCGVEIPKNFNVYNDYLTYESLASSKGNYAFMIAETGGKGASGNCVSCKKCEELCPQGIKISEIMMSIDKTLA